MVDLTALADRNFALGSALSFILGIGLYGSVYLMPVFLAYVRGHGALEIGEIMLVTGAAQLASAPIAVWLEKRMSASLLSALGFALFSVGLAMSVHDTPRTDFAEMFWPQALRGFSIMFCLLPPTRAALGHFPPERIPDASGLFNLMRNLGGAIGLAVIDTIVFGRVESVGHGLAERLMRGDGDAFAFVGLPPMPSGTIPTIDMLMSVRPAIEKAALTIAITQAWALAAVLTALGVLFSLLLRRQGA